MTDLERALYAIDLKFRSGNEIPVERAMVRATEWAALKEALAKLIPPESA